MLMDLFGVWLKGMYIYGIFKHLNNQGYAGQ
jgi:hypothetical protein